MLPPPDGCEEFHGGPLDNRRLPVPSTGTLVLIHTREDFTRVECTYNLRMTAHWRKRMVLEKMAELPPVDIEAVLKKPKKSKKRGK